MIPAAGSSQESRRFGQLLAPLLELFAGEGNVTDHLVRKLAHFAEYAMLGALTYSVLLARKRTSFFHWSYGLLCAPEAAGCLQVHFPSKATVSPAPARRTPAWRRSRRA